MSNRTNNCLISYYYYYYRHLVKKTQTISRSVVKKNNWEKIDFVRLEKQTFGTYCRPSPGRVCFFLPNHVSLSGLDIRKTIASQNSIPIRGRDIMTSHCRDDHFQLNQWHLSWYHLHWCILNQNLDKSGCERPGVKI